MRSESEGSSFNVMTPKARGSSILRAARVMAFMARFISVRMGSSRSDGSGLNTKSVGFGDTSTTVPSGR